MEQINLTSCQPAPSLDAISAIEEKVGHAFPDSFREFIQKNNGGSPPDEHQIWSDSDRDLSLYLQYFFPVEKLLTERQSFPGKLEEAVIPIALEGGGSYLLLDMASGHILVWDYESESIHDIAPDVDSLLGACTS